MCTDEEADAGTTSAWSGGVFADPLPSELADGPSKPPLDSLRESPAAACEAASRDESPESRDPPAPSAHPEFTPTFLRMTECRLFSI